ncbi:hypothetical protein [Deinococcus maricopensis]|uniref:Uncharacterized protein n=1 Tax=Deinococcus maricopensis (strain DSM 21211 / LMG 22137 / NRRL B-23946 / LB-34) TaxID=709986 RepID=E8U718_DEIML|nr:hypothetical protein [Deinococcus maricopensis]ADV66857.1 hypothetical protein Deima_1206 [Deinococcus maricopensis DSM 21211]
MKNWQCSWVPGTMNRVQIKGENASTETTIDKLVRAFGAPILTDLYLRGRAVISTERDLLKILA